MSQNWYSNGKLMLTGEYLVLFGAKALAIPLCFGQSLDVKEEAGQGTIYFDTEVLGKPWFDARFDSDTFEIIDASNASSACYLQELFLGARVLNPSFLKQKKKVTASTKINFDTSWGLGSSSTLISNIAWWANIDPFELNRIVSIGSGYDIACARSQSAIFYWLTNDVPTIKPITFKPKYAKKIWFVYRGNKMVTETHLEETIEKINPSFSEIKEISNISIAFSRVQTATECCQLIKSHESIVSGILKKPTLQSSRFQNFNGAIKSLGAWGGDFCMAVSEENEGYVKEYFEQKGYKTVLSFNELALPR